jgi:hypothetical protein
MSAIISKALNTGVSLARVAGTIINIMYLRKVSLPNSLLFNRIPSQSNLTSKNLEVQSNFLKNLSL